MQTKCAKIRTNNAVKGNGIVGLVVVDEAVELCVKIESKLRRFSVRDAFTRVCVRECMGVSVSYTHLTLPTKRIV